MRTALQALAAAKATSIWYPINSCLNFVWNMYGRPDNGATGVPLGWADQSWQFTKAKNTGRDYPLGAPIYWRDPHNYYGHIAIYMGNGYVWSTYTPDGVHGVAGPVSIAHIEQGWGFTYLGWGGDFAGYPIDYGSAPSPTPAPVPKAPAPITPPPITTRKRNMNYIMRHQTGALAWVFPAIFEGQGGYRHITSAEWNVISACEPDIRVANVTDADWQSIINTLKPVSGVVGQ